MSEKKNTERNLSWIYFILFHSCYTSYETSTAETFGMKYVGPRCFRYSSHYIYIYIYIHICVYFFVYIIYVHLYIHIHTSMCVSACMYPHVYFTYTVIIPVFVIYTYTHIYITCMNIFICIYMAISVIIDYNIRFINLFIQCMYVYTSI